VCPCARSVTIVRSSSGISTATVSTCTTNERAERDWWFLARPFECNTGGSRGTHRDRRGTITLLVFKSYRRRADRLSMALKLFDLPQTARGTVSSTCVQGVSQSRSFGSRGELAAPGSLSGNRLSSDRMSALGRNCHQQPVEIASFLPHHFCVPHRL
jgi:hypothetical protein